VTGRPAWRRRDSAAAGVRCVCGRRPRWLRARLGLHPGLRFPLRSGLLLGGAVSECGARRMPAAEAGGTPIRCGRPIAEGVEGRRSTGTSGEECVCGRESGIRSQKRYWSAFRRVYCEDSGQDGFSGPSPAFAALRCWEFLESFVTGCAIDAGLKLRPVPEAAAGFAKLQVYA